MAEQKIQLINAISFAKGTTEPSNREVWWIDDNITGNVYNKLKYFNVDSGSWELVQRTAAQLLLDLKTVDGAGSGLDADTLDGYTAAELLQGEIKLSSGEILVGQLNDQAAAKTLSGIATIDVNGALSYVANSISHTGLTDIGSNTHAQIDTHIADSTIHFTQASIDHTAIQNIGVNTHAQIDSHISSTANPHGVTAAQVGNTTAQWNANSIEGNLTNVGVLGAGQDGQALVWDNATSRFITAAVSSPSLYTGSGTVPTSVVATLTDTLTFKGADLLGASSNIKIVDSSSSSLWDFRNNGDLHIGKNVDWYIGSNDIDIIGSGSSTSQLLLRNSDSAARTRYGIVGAASSVLEIGYYGSISTLGSYSTTYRDKFYVASSKNYRHTQYNSSSYELVTDNSLLTSPTVRMTMNSNGEFLFGSSSPTSGVKVHIEGRSRVQGADTLSTSTAFEIYDGDTVPSSLWDFRNNGDVYMGKASTVHLQGNQLDFDNGQTTFRGVGTTVTTASLRAENSSGTRTFSVANDGTGYFLKDLDVTERLRVNGGSTSLGFSAAIKGNVNLLLEDLASSKIASFASTGNRFIATTKFGHNSNATGIVEIRGSNTSSATADFKIEDSSASSKFEVRNNGDIYTNGTQGLSATYTFGGGSTGDIASMTFTNGILTAVTTVP